MKSERIKRMLFDIADFNSRETIKKVNSQENFYGCIWCFL